MAGDSNANDKGKMLILAFSIAEIEPTEH